jgi:hypothetical protein
MFANTWATVYRGDSANEYADPTDLNEAVDGLERIPMAITEQSRTVMDPETDTPRVVRYATGRARAGADIRADDRIFDERQNRWWAVRSVSGGGFTFIGGQDLSLDLRAV